MQYIPWSTYKWGKLHSDSNHNQQSESEWGGNRYYLKVTFPFAYLLPKKPLFTSPSPTGITDDNKKAPGGEQTAMIDYPKPLEPMFQITWQSPLSDNCDVRNSVLTNYFRATLFRYASEGSGSAVGGSNENNGWVGRAYKKGPVT